MSDRQQPACDPANVVTVSLTKAGAGVASRLPFLHHEPQRDQGGLAGLMKRLWQGRQGFVVVGATGIAVRAVAPLLNDKRTDPAVVCVDDQARWVIPLTGGHHGANELAREVAALLDAEPVVTTASDSDDTVVPLDSLPGFTAEGDLAGVMRSWLDGTPPVLANPDLPAWPLPPGLAQLARTGEPSAPGSASDGPLIRVTDRRPTAETKTRGTAVLRPKSLVLGVGSSSGADPEGVAELVDRALNDAGLHVDALGLVASVDLKASEPGIVALAERLGVELRTFPAETLAELTVPNPSDVVRDAVGTPSVAEAAALAGAGLNAELVVTKQRSAEATVAVARRARPEGKLRVVGLGPGDPALRTPDATRAIRNAQVVVGYGPYIDLARDLLSAHHEVVRSPIGAEAERCSRALDLAANGRRVALVCSGDAGVYAMASLVCELASQHGNPPIEVVPGVTAAVAAAALLGAPLGHDHAYISLSDLLTPWEAIERRLHAVAESDMVVALYNPRSARRTWQLIRALEILAKHRPPDCPAAIATDVGRPDQHVVRTTLTHLDPEQVGMLSLVLVGSSTTRWAGGRMVTPRGYQW